MSSKLSEEFEKMSDFLYSGIKTVDMHHEKFFKMLHELKLYSSNKESIQIFKELFYEFCAYADYHFIVEERMMTKCRYQYLNQHKQEHQMFKQKLNEFKKSFEYNNLVVDKQMLRFFRMWLLVHICDHDKQFAKTVLSQRN